ncbi:DUF2971 domain-containing protein [Novacetimonas hansenii]|uniref:DUF2971 domain-containing protein n=1 Tax=Novacetimonas hansenii TaxID=436 RepID=UPI001C4BF23B|nr:DUF2971 domain-containing protein [Novacetimonas hansenii]
MPLRVEFFENLLIRATPAISLNDPFEFVFNENQVKNSNKNFLLLQEEKNTSFSEEDADFQVKNDCEVIDSELRDLGVLSFTEDYNNILMWSHYANEHKGMVVEFDLSKPLFSSSILEICGRRHRFKEDVFGFVNEYPKKIKYRSEFPEFDRPEFSNPTDGFSYPWKKFNEAILYTKADAWMYEKEYRSIVHLKDADVIMCENYNSYIEEICLQDEKIIVSECNGRTKICFPDEYEMHEDMGDQSLKTEIFFRTQFESEKNLHLFKINPECISSIFFGCYADTDLIHKSILFAKENLPNLSTENIFKMERSNYLYRLEKNKFI